MAEALKDKIEATKLAIIE